MVPKEDYQPKTCRSLKIYDELSHLAYDVYREIKFPVYRRFDDLSEFDAEVVLQFRLHATAAGVFTC